MISRPQPSMRTRTFLGEVLFSLSFVPLSLNWDEYQLKAHQRTSANDFPQKRDNASQSVWAFWDPNHIFGLCAGLLKWCNCRSVGIYEYQLKLTSANEPFERLVRARHPTVYHFYLFLDHSLNFHPWLWGSDRCILPSFGSRRIWQVGPVAKRLAKWSVCEGVFPGGVSNFWCFPSKLGTPEKLNVSNLKTIRLSGALSGGWT